MFDEKGQIIISKEELEDADIALSADDLMMIALDAGAEDFSEEEDSFEDHHASGGLQRSERSNRGRKNPDGECRGHNVATDVRYTHR